MPRDLPEEILANTWLEANAWLIGHGGLIHAFLSSLSMVLVSELGDETFIIAAILAMRHPRSLVFAGGIAALATMTVLSTLLGMMAPALVSKELVNKAACFLYICFGCRLMYIAATSNESVDEELEEKKGQLESGTAITKRGVRLFLSRLFSAIFVESFVLIFLAEWGDRSQITTIALASHMNPFGVTVGAILGHCFCTGLAVIGGSLIAKRISQRAVAATGGLLFFTFAFLAAVYGAPGTGDR